MVRHKAPRRNANTIADEFALEQREHPISILVVFKDANAAISTRDNVVIAR